MPYKFAYIPLKNTDARWHTIVGRISLGNSQA